MISITSYDIPLIIAYIIVLFNLFIDTFLRPNADTRSFDLDNDTDKSSTLFVCIAFIIVLGVPVLILWVVIGLNDNLGIGVIESPYREILSWSGIILILFGFGLRAYAMRINQFFTRTLRIGEGQFIVTEGPYRYIRHPGYAGQLLMWHGFALSSGNWFVFIIISIIINIAYWYRIRCEEFMLLRTFGVDYLEYSTRVKKIIPFIY
ncbi:659_t:CDS:2 [Cetraspora pellucida]|uniref:659_t:CDS:1 n=1 Tax=Cetraspora pellucida TaxID=1433469 RepID=A0A9N8W9M8_9GLOM|nr:659_t:CDS:2 [Cetraspora pellucida]